MAWQRYGIYWAPDGTLGQLGAEWLGWDTRAGAEVPDPHASAPRARRYGFHMTLKAPFHLEESAEESDLREGLKEAVAGRSPVSLGLLQIDRMGNFLAFTPERTEGVSDLAAHLVAALNRFRAPPSLDELARRRKKLSLTQEALLGQWGYPFVMAEFRPHVTLSDATPQSGLMERAADHFAPALQDATRIDRVSLVGEDGEGRFHVLEDAALSG